MSSRILKLFLIQIQFSKEFKESENINTVLWVTKRNDNTIQFNLEFTLSQNISLHLFY